MTMQWKDMNLVWNPEEYDNITQFQFNTKEIWTPDIQLLNRISGDQGIELSADSKYRAFVNFNGQTEFQPIVTLKAICPMHLTWFPFDSQNCTLQFGSLGYSEARMDMRLSEKNNGAEVLYYQENGEWQLVGFSGRRVVEKTAGETWILIEFEISLKRRPLYYFLTLLVPCALIGFLALLGFTLRPDSNEKLSLGVTLLFSLILFLNAISESMPANSGSFPILGIYLNCVMLLIAMSVVSTIIVNLKSEKEVPNLVKLVVLKWLGSLITNVKTTDTSFFGMNQKHGPTTDANAEENKNRIQMDWNSVALVVDKFCLILSLGITTVAMTWAMLRSNCS